MHPRASIYFFKIERFKYSLYLYISMEEELKCPLCKSSQTRYRIKTDDRICNTCGNIYKIDKEVKE